jgi:hypothetical protein
MVTLLEPSSLKEIHRPEDIPPSSSVDFRHDAGASAMIGPVPSLKA